MKAITFLLCFAIAIIFPAQIRSQNIDKRFDGIDTAFARVLKDWNAAGFAVAVVEKNKVIYEKGFGYRDVENKLPVTPNTLFAIGSCTKAFTAALIGLLEKDGKVDIDKPVELYMPALKFFNDPMNNTVTLRDMMSHRTGLPRHDFSWYFFSSSSRDSILQRIQYQEPTAPVRDKWQYNNFMFMAQGAITEKFTGKSWEENVREKFFKPLGMTNSNFTINEWKAYSESAIGYGLKRDSIIKKLDYYNIAAMGPAGAINSSVHEMANWVITWINGGKYNGKEIIPAKHFTQAISPQAIVNPGLPTKERPDVFFATYGFGWALASYKGHYRVEHGGNIDGFSASTSFFPTDSVGIIVLTNQNGSSVPSIVRNLISDRLLNQKYYDWNSDLKKQVQKNKVAQAEAKKTAVSNRKLNTSPTHPLKDYAGIYNHPGYGNMEVYLNKDSLFAKGSESTLWLKHYHYDVFDIFDKDMKEGIDTSDGPGPVKFQFQMNTAGDIESITIPFEAGLKPIVFTKQLKAKDVNKQDLQKYTGEYDLTGITVKVYIKNEKTLYALVPGQPEYELVPVDKDKFGLKVIPGYFIQFSVDDKNKVTDLTFIQPNGNFKAVRK
ncbi:MAG TPA: serine hydrolase [Chitinophagaceae bacterium]|nr:serine hydrolase [Chitinophagaceae bacterium]